jgi:hypothetical protein
LKLISPETDLKSRRPLNWHRAAADADHQANAVAEFKTRKITDEKGDKAMKKRSLLAVAVFFLLTQALFAVETDSTPKQTDGDAADATAPQAFLPEKSFSFKEVLEGDVVTHGFIIENRGNAPLDIISVRTSCGCTTTSHQRPKTLSPGKKDEIIVKGNTRGYGGRAFNKTITVTTNDPNQRKIKLKFSGPVSRFASINPTGINLRGTVGEVLQSEAIITPEPRYPFKITEMVLKDGLQGKIDADLDQQDGKYHVVVKNRVEKAGAYRGRIVLKTDSAVRPELAIYVSAYIKKKKS